MPETERERAKERGGEREKSIGDYSRGYYRN